MAGCAPRPRWAPLMGIDQKINIRWYEDGMRRPDRVAGSIYALMAGPLSSAGSRA
jgi:hypothetical protein